MKVDIQTKMYGNQILTIWTNATSEEAEETALKEALEAGYTDAIVVGIWE